MKEAQYSTKKSIFSRLIDAIRNSILSDILVSEEAGQVISPEDLDSETRVIKLARETNTDEKDMWNYEKAFNEAASALEKKEKEITKVPDDKKEQDNPFKVDEADLDKSVQPLDTKAPTERTTSNKERVD